MKRACLALCVLLLTVTAGAFPPVGSDQSTTESLRAFLGLSPDQPIAFVQAPTPPDPRAPIQYRTEDGVIIHAVYGKAVGESKGTVILVHQHDGTHRDFESFGGWLLSNHYSVLAMDLRGHGRSVMTEDGQTIDFSKFKNDESGNEYLGLIKDVEAGIVWLEQKGFHNRGDQLFVIGTGTGSNIGGIAAVKNASKVNACVLISPLSVYRGLDLGDEIRNVQGRPILALASAQDSSGVNVLRTLKGRNRDLRQQLLPEPGYGRELLATQSGRMHILGFLETTRK